MTKSILYFQLLLIRCCDGEECDEILRTVPNLEFSELQAIISLYMNRWIEFTTLFFVDVSA